jgi:hypothetical protein
MQVEFVPALMVGFSIDLHEQAAYAILLFVGVCISWE